MPRPAQPMAVVNKTRVQAPIPSDLHTKLRVIMVQTGLTWGEILETALADWMAKHWPGVTLDATPNKTPPT